MTSSIRWVLQRAFGAPVVDETLATDLTPEEARTAVELAGRLGLAARIGARQPRLLLTRELGEEGAEGLRALRLAVSASEMRLDVVAEAVARVAAQRTVPIAFVKGYALRLLGVVAEGGRGSVDLDVLVPVAAVEGLQTALVEAGFRPADSREREHQLPPLTHPSGGVVELHRLLLGVRVGSLARRGKSATLDALVAADLLVEAPPLPGRPLWPGGCSIPRRAVLVAHLLAHGIAQHGWEPHGYPAFRMVADLIDLGVAKEEPPEGAAGEWPWILAAVGEELTVGEAEAARRLARQLRAGDLSAGEADPEEEASAALLHHLLAGALDEEYCRSLRFRLVAQPLTDRGAAGGFVRVLRRTLVPTRSEMGRIHGKRLSPAGYLGRLLLRPADLLLRAGRYAISALRLRSR